MKLDRQHRARWDEFREFVDAEVLPRAAAHDESEELDPALVRRLADQRYLAADLPESMGGRNLDMISYGLLHEEVGRACSSTRSLLTVHDMVAHAVACYGSQAQRDRWLPRLASGEIIAAYGLTEQHGGSDVTSIRSSVVERRGGFVLHGGKRWISFGSLADLFLVFARSDSSICALLVPRDTPGLEIMPSRGLLGVRASMLAELRFEGCELPAEALLGRLSSGHPRITTTTLTRGRLSVACGCIGIVQACLDAAVQWAHAGREAGAALAEHQLVQRLIARMITDVEAGRLLWVHLAGLLEQRDARAPISAAVAKYFAAVAAATASRAAVQIHGASGCAAGSEVARLFRDAKVMEIIEGSNEVQESFIGKHGYGARSSLLD